MLDEPKTNQKNVLKSLSADESPEAGPSRVSSEEPTEEEHSQGEEEDRQTEEEDGSEDEFDGMDPEGFSGERTLKPLTPEALAAFKAAQDRAGVIYISRIPPGMRPAKVRHLMSAYGAVGRVYLQQEDAKRAYLRRKFTSTKKAHYTEGWVEFKDKKVARSVAEMLNAQPIGGKKGTRWRDDIWTMKYLPRFKWYMLTEQVAHEAAVHTAKLRVELSQSKSEQQQYLKNVELARVLEKRAAKKKEKGEEFELKPNPQPKKRRHEGEQKEHTVKKKKEIPLDSVLNSIF
ncbi:Pre-rRNA-processing protein ESF2 [Psilocybe cubensis]|uniref:Pre-rRNA-processing protein ESF2 n=2 Tax=Psilocybe cubensis TaxID=181762 RepID=A0ACB8H5D7_PSICU|nr:Pre-rRNA-processing protein ESF2 [Psilocybe cubensis]KAH9483111.1 Pre-rRNA-processing protein ESF2 [Psilocybe cubensis]